MICKQEAFLRLVDRNEAKVPEIRRKWFQNIAECPECGAELYDGQKFCDMCGQRLKWEDNEV